MTDTQRTGTARTAAAKAMSNSECGPAVPADVRRYHEIRMGHLLDAIPTDLLQRLHDERLMADSAVTPEARAAMEEHVAKQREKFARKGWL